MNRQFGALSGLAIVLIVLNHSIEIGLNPPQGMNYPQLNDWAKNLLSVFQAFGVFAVPIFLFISGSFIAYAARGNPPKLSFKFLSNSLKHILIPYIIWSGLFYLVAYLLYGQSNSFFGYVKDLLVGYPYHFIPLLVFYYLISPLIVRIGKTHPLFLLIILAAYQLFLIIVLQPGIIGFHLPDWSYSLTPPVLRTTMADWGIFFPLGLVYGLHTNQIKAWIMKVKWILIVLLLTFFILGLMSYIFKIINFPIARHLSMVVFILLIPVIKRDSIPIVRQLEKLGKRSYGIYLSHLIVLDLIFLLFQNTTRGIFSFPFILFPVLFAAGLLIPLGIMELFAIAPSKRYYQYVFG